MGQVSETDRNVKILPDAAAAASLSLLCPLCPPARSVCTQEAKSEYKHQTFLPECLPCPSRPLVEMAVCEVTRGWGGSGQRAGWGPVLDKESLALIQYLKMYFAIDTGYGALNYTQWILHLRGKYPPQGAEGSRPLPH